MKKIVVRFFVAMMLLIPISFVQAAEPLVLYDNFNSALINPDKWFGSEFSGGREVFRTVQNGQLRLLDRVYGNNGSNSGYWHGNIRLSFMNPSTITTIKTTVSASKFECVGCNANPGSSSWAAAYIQGFYFNTGNSTPGNNTNDVRARIGIEASTNNSTQPQVLDVIANIQKCLNSDCSTTETIATKNLGTASLAQKVILYIKWDKLNHRFILRRDSQPLVYARYDAVKYPEKSSPGNNVKRLVAAGSAANCTGSPRPVGFMDAFFDNVYINP